MRMSFFLDDSPPTTLSAGLTTVATVTTRVHGCVGTHLFKVALPTEPRKSSLRAGHGCRTPRVPDLMILAISTCDHHSVPGSPLIKDHVPADTEPSWEPHGPKARRLTICNSSPRALRRLSTAVVAHDLRQQSRFMTTWGIACQSWIRRTSSIACSDGHPRG